MLLIDDRMLNLARMQETLLERSVNDRRYNLEKYKNTVKIIDKEAFSYILTELEQIKKHNQTLEDELQFLQSIKASYEQLLEQQLSFRRVCELYGDKELELSDLSIIDIDYIDNRINLISGYLINLKNLDINKEKISKLNEQLYEEEKKHDFLNKKIQDYEQVLRDIFLNAEGRISVDGNLVPTSTVLEYKKIGLDLKTLLYDSQKINKLLEAIMIEANDSGDKYKAAEICYNNAPNANNKQILDEISKEYLKIKYKLIMLKLLKLLSSSSIDYDQFLEKREQLLDLIKSKNVCLEQLNIKHFVDPFNIDKILEQIKEVSSFGGNYNNILRIKKEIAKLNDLIEEMITQNNTYMVELSNTKNLLREKKEQEDESIAPISRNIDDYFTAPVPSENQIVGIKDLPKQFNLGIAMQKTNLVLIRVSSMIKESPLSSKESSSEVIPKLVVIPSSISPQKEKSDDSRNKSIDSLISPNDKSENEHPTLVENTKSIDDTNIFETLVPFEATPMFTDKREDSLELEDFISDSLSNKELENISTKEENSLEMNYSDSNEDEMPNAFWVTKSDPEKDNGSNEDEEEEQFDEQIKKLLASSTDDKVINDTTKTKKRQKDIIKNVA